MRPASRNFVKIPQLVVISVNRKRILFRILKSHFFFLQHLRMIFQVTSCIFNRSRSRQELTQSAKIEFREKMTLISLREG